MSFWLSLGAVEVLSAHNSSSTLMQIDMAFTASAVSIRCTPRNQELHHMMARIRLVAGHTPAGLLQMMAPAVLSAAGVPGHNVDCVVVCQQIVLDAPQVKETVGGIMGSAEEATSDTASKAVEQVCPAGVN